MVQWKCLQMEAGFKQVREVIEGNQEAAIQDFQDALLDIFDLRREEGRDVLDIAALRIRRLT